MRYDRTGWDEDELIEHPVNGDVDQNEFLNLLTEDISFPHVHELDLEIKANYFADYELAGGEDIEQEYSCDSDDGEEEGGGDTEVEENNK